ncbi:MAG: DNA polymerase IV [Clostridiales bacterium]|nr:DNA polymerase IV [Clostridiales bacterium]
MIEVSDTNKRLVFHVDVNSAFLSWEAARRVKLGEPDLRLVPSAIGGDPEKRTGVILAKSIPAKKYGVKTGEPIAAALRKCPKLQLARPNFKLYETSSHAFMDICREYAPIVEKYSIDECFLDMTGTERVYPDPIATAHEIKDKIRDKLGFTVNIGIGSNRLLAKMASDFEKPDKVHTLFTNEIEQKMWQLPVRELFGIGHSTAERLERAGISTIGILARCGVEAVQYLVGDKLGRMIYDYANGIDDSPVLEESPETKGFSISTTVASDITDRESAHGVLLALVDSVTARMRADSQYCTCVAVTIRSNDFKNRSHQRKLSEATDITSEIYEITKRLFDELWDSRTPLRLLGVALTDLTRERMVQLTLFDDEKSEERRERSRALDHAVDMIRSRYGSDMITRGRVCKSELEVGRKYRAKLEEMGRELDEK